MLAVECQVLMNSINLLFIPFSPLPYLILSIRTSCAKPSHIMCQHSARHVLSIITLFINAFFYLILSPFYYLSFILFIAFLPPSPFEREPSWSPSPPNSQQICLPPPSGRVGVGLLLHHLILSSLASLPLRRRAELGLFYHLTLSKFASLPLRGGSGWGFLFYPHDL